MFTYSPHATLCRTFTVRVNGVGSAVLPTGVASFTSFEMAGPIHVEIELPFTIEDVTIRPLSLGLGGTHDGNTISLELDRPCNLWVDIRAKQKVPPLYLFAYAMCWMPAGCICSRGTPRELPSPNFVELRCDCFAAKLGRSSSGSEG